LRREKKKRGEDIPARGGEENRKGVEKIWERKKETLVFFTNDEEEEEVHLLSNEGFWSFNWDVSLMDN
jgi:hypothetical protein